MTELMRRRRALMAAQGGSIPQLIPDQTHTFSDGTTIAISNGNHIRMEFETASNALINLSDMSKNGTSPSNSSVNNLPDVLVSFPAWSNATITVSNFTKTPREVLASSSGQMAIGFRKTGESVTAIGGVGYLSTSNVVQSNTVSFETATDSSCLFAYLRSVKTGESIEFDVGLSINGQTVI